MLKVEMITASVRDFRMVACQSGTHDVYAVENYSVETNMRTGETVVVLTISEEPISTSARDFEPHPGHEAENAWML